jgi:3-oxoacyl-[acyl-carrier protein] reductase
VTTEVPPADRVILITGARKGIGRSLVQHYLDRGHHVIGCSRKPGALSAPRYEEFLVDVSEEQAVLAMMASVERKYGRLDYLINNAGVASMNHVLLTSFASALETIRANFLGTFLCCREGVKLMRRRRFGRIVNLSSVAVPMELEGEAVYAASKAAVECFTRVLAREVAPFGVTCNVVGPNPIRTDLLAGVPEEKLDALVRRQPIREFGRIEDITHVVDSFLADDGRLLTGQVVYLGGA